MEILFISHKYPPAVGGMEKYSYELVEGFIRKGHQVHKLIYEGEGNKIMWLLSVVSKAEDILKQNPGIELIHLNDGLMTFFARKLKKVTDVPVVSTFHGLDITFPLGIYQKKYIPRFNQFKGFVTVSRGTKAAAVKRGIDAAKTKAIPNGVDHDLKDFVPDADKYADIISRFGVDVRGKKVIAGLGRGVRRKGYSWFVKNVLPQLSEDVIFVMMGPKSNYPNTHRYLSKLLPKKWLGNLELFLGSSTDDVPLLALENDPKFEGRYIRTDYLPFNEICQVLSHSHLFIMPNQKEENDMEGFGLVALEASILGTYVMAAGIDGITDAIIDGGNGSLLESGNSQQWISEINNYMAKKDHEVEGQKSKEFTLANFSWSKMVDSYIEYFQELIDQ